MRSDLRRYVALFARYKRYATGVVVLELLCIALFFLEPLFLMVFVNECVLKTNLNLLIVLVAAMLATGAAALYFYALAKAHSQRLGQKVLADLRRDLYGRLLGQPPRFFETHPPGNLVALTTAEIDALDAIREALFWGVATAFGIVLILAFALAIEPRLVPFLLIPFAFMAGLLALDGRLRRHAGAALERQARLIAYLKQRLMNVATIQAFGRAAAEERRLAAIGDDLVEARARTEQFSQVMTRLFEVSRVLASAGILVLGGVHVIRRGDMTLGAVTAVFAYAGLLFQELSGLFDYIVRARRAAVALRRVHEAYDVEPPIAEHAGERTIERATGAIAFDDVWFRYAPDAAWALRAVSFEARAGQFIAVVGLSGSGKSTLGRLLLRFYDPERGSVAIDGIDLKQLKPSSLRAQIGIATQDAVIFDGTVAENIAYGREGASREEIIAAARVAVAHDFIERLPRGYDTPIGEGAADLSGGQRHRVALARVALKGAPILILDEVTAGLDAKTEAELQTALAAAARGRTTIVIAHRLSTIIRADLILVMDRGRIVQRGTHRELYAARGGLYRFLFDRQFRDAMESLGLEHGAAAPERVTHEAATARG